MSIPLQPISLSTFIVGQGSSIDLTQIEGLGSSFYSQQQPILFLFNDSGSGLRCIWDAGGGFTLPAGGWAPFPIPPNASKLTFTVLYILPTPSVQLLLGTYFHGGETVVTPTLGNSPTGGNFSTNINQIKNDGNPVGTNIIEATSNQNTSGTSEVSVTNDGNLTIGYAVGAVFHQILTLLALPSPVQTADTAHAVIINSVLQLISQLLLSTGGAPVDPGNNGTITVGSAIIVSVNPAANETGWKLTSGSSGQVFILLNRSAFTGTFAAVGTSLVADGILAVLPANRIMFFVWDSGFGAWNHA